MSARILTIKHKLRQSPIALVSLDDFQYQEDAAIDPHIVLERANISLYCLDHANKRAIFVETPLDVNLAAASFYYQTQYQSARRLIAVSYDTLQDLAREIHIDPSQIILIYSIGRCGSTLVSHAFNRADGVISFSEPDVYTQILMLRATVGSDDAELIELVRSCTQVMCASAAQNRRAKVWVLKFRSFVIELGDIIYNNFPGAKVIFLYRHVEGWAQSIARAFHILDPEFVQRLPQIQQLFSRLVPLVAVYIAKHKTISPIQLLTCMWISAMERCLALQGQGIPMFVARYEELQAAPHEMFHAMFEYCGVTVSNAGVIDKVLEQDSQAGTNLSQANTRKSTSELQEHHLVEMRGFMREYSTILTPDFIVPNTFRPTSR